MSNIPRVYRSTDPGAPVLNGQPGSFAMLMDAVLVDGYGSGAASKPGLGWIRAYSAPNKRVFRNDPLTYSGSFIRFDDSNTQYVLVDAYEQMSGVDAGTERFDSAPTAWAKSGAASSAARAWLIVGTSKCCYIFVVLGDSTPYGFWFGDFNRLGPNDIWNFAYLKTGHSSYSASTGLFRSTGAQAHGFCTSRRSDGVYSGQARLWHRQSVFASATFYGTTGLAYPLPTTNGALLSRGVLNEGTNGGINLPPRGTLPGLWVPEHNVANIFTHGVEYTDFVGLPAGAVLMGVVATNSTSPITTHCFLDLTLEW